MSYVITQPCIGVKDASCVDVCPVDCIHPSHNEPGFDESAQLFINPMERMDYTQRGFLSRVNAKLGIVLVI